jgi:hypothetical protein
MIYKIYRMNLEKKVFSRRQHLPGIDIEVITAFGDM